MRNTIVVKYDTGDTAEDFWTFLDEHQNNTNLYIIGTTNRVDKLPPQIQSRLRGSLIEIKRPATEIGTRNIFLQLFNTKFHELGRSCNTAFVLSLLRDDYIKQWNARDFAVLRSLAVRLARRGNRTNTRTVIEAQHVIAARDSIKGMSSAMKYGTEEESEEKIMHKENLAQQKELHKENMLVQKEHFVQGLVIQKAMQSNQVGAGGGIGFTCDALTGPKFNASLSGSVNNISWSDACITNGLSDEQIKLYREQKQAKKQRDAGRVRVNQLLSDLKTRVSGLKEIKQRLATVNSPSAQSLITNIDKIILHKKQLSKNFQSIPILSQEELSNFTQKISTFNTAIDTLRSLIETSGVAIQNSTNLIFDVDYEKLGIGKEKRN